MPQTFYVTQDEEILSLVGRLRSSALLENVFVVPKRALILQSVVNLRMLAREAEKIGKSVVISTQDNEGRLLAEKAGIATRPYSEEMLVSEKEIPAVSQQQGNSPVTERMIDHAQQGSIGSDDFYGTGVAVSQPIEAAPAKPAVKSAGATEANPSVETTLRIRDDASIGNQMTSDMSVSQSLEQERSGEAIRRQALSSRPTSAEIPVTRPGESSDAQGKLSRIYRNREPASYPTGAGAATSRQAGPHEGAGHVGGKVKFWFFLFIGVSVLSLAGTGMFLFLPKAEIVVIPNSVARNVEMEFDGKKDASADEQAIPIRLIEKEMDILVSVETSGDSSGNGEKARGKIIIFNDFSNEPQPLVATTRFESSDGVIFRLIRGVTVPGISESNGERKPGAIEAEVMADAAGEAYNIEPSTFTIPGFKSSPKYSKFSAKSNATMSGGTSQGGSVGRAVALSDVSNAKKESEQKFLKDFESAVKAELSESERFVLSSANIELIGAPSYPQIGTAASSFEYAATWKGKFFVFSEEHLQEKAVEFFKTRSEQGSASDIRDISFEYGEASADYEKETLSLRARVSALSVERVDTAALKDALLGKNAEGVREVIGEHPEIKKIDINLKPKLFIFSVPKDGDRVSVTIEES